VKRLGLASLVPLLLLSPACRRAEDQARGGRVQALKKHQEELYAQLSQRIEGDTIVSQALTNEGDILVGIRSGLLKDLITAVAVQYLDQVALDLALEAKVAAEGDIHVKKAIIGDVTAGTWKVNLVVHRVRGTLGARTPVVDMRDNRTIGLRLPVSLDKGRGNATIHFEWDARGLANVVCRDFEVTRTINGTLVPAVHTFEGSLVLEAGDENVLAQPAFKNVPYRLKVDLTPESWKDVTAALVEQDSFFKCGIGLDPDAIVPRLRELLLKGFNVRLPKKLFRAFALPGSLSRRLEHEGRQLVLNVKPDALRFANDALWYGSLVEARVQPQAPKGRPSGPVTRARP
jgi:hypothetical protein